MTIRAVIVDTVLACIAYVVGLVALLLWPERANADQTVVSLVGVGVFAIAAVAGDWFVHRRRPSLQQLFRRDRPSRFSIPNFIGLFTALMIAGWLRTSAPREWGLSVYALFLLVLAGVTASNLWWAHSSTRLRGDSPAR